ncbi:MAG TPA: hypothetical protein VFG77_01005 [Nitrososphaeraceae archaeon]|nr:hypothetical protein [Nitrososphaeraceae archaeon]
MTVESVYVNGITLLYGISSRFNMRIRYWRLTTEDLFRATYPLERANHWEIKCLQGEYEHFGIFWYKYGTPYDKEPIHGLAIYYNDIPKNKVDELIEMLHDSFGGEILRRQSRVFLNGSKEFTDPEEIAKLAVDIGDRFKGPVEITIEFEEISNIDRQENLIKLPSSKLLEIPGLS